MGTLGERALSPKVVGFVPMGVPLVGFLLTSGGHRIILSFVTQLGLRLGI